MRSARFRAAFVAAFLGLTPAAGSGQDQQALQVIDHPPSIVIVPQQPAIFSLSAAKEVEAGNRIAVTLSRQRKDGQTHNFQWSFDPRGVVSTSPQVIIEDSSPSWTGELDTFVNQPGEGSRTLQISLTSTDQPSALVYPPTVDVLVVPAPTFTVRALDDAVRRGDPVVFTVVRNGGSGQKAVSYSIIQGGNSIRKANLLFEPGGAPQNIGISDYDLCGEPLSFELVGVKGQTNATAAFARDLPRGCSPTPPPAPWEQVARDWWPWWAVALGAIFAGLAWQALRPRPPRNDTNEPHLRGELNSRFFIRAGESGFPKGEPRQKLPTIEKRFDVVVGEMHCPKPLPLRNTIDE